LCFVLHLLHLPLQIVDLLFELLHAILHLISTLSLPLGLFIGLSDSVIYALELLGVFILQTEQVFILLLELSFQVRDAQVLVIQHAVFDFDKLLHVFNFNSEIIDLFT
jgi:hypothetical protein